ncbi:MAG TPA: tetratricopeptide repeat protein, partial [Thermoanaerobaculia bacterium]|nr:tetratricopeptide repeat protein [Thermoanaerobaculia bacterium]
VFTMHRLMQEVVRNQIPEERRTDWLELVLALVDRFAPRPAEDVKTWPIWDLLRPHAVQLLAHAEREALISRSRASLMSELGLLFGAKGLYPEAEPLMRKALDIEERLSGGNSPEIGIYLNNLGMLLKVMGRLEEAEPLMRRSAEICFSLAEASPYATMPINGLALLLMEKQQWAEAEELLQRALTLDQDMYGGTHTYVGRDLHNLALLLISTGRTVEAETLSRRSLEILSAAHGETHPRPARAMQVLAGILRDLGRPDEAEPLARHALEILENALGPDHPMTQSARRDLDTLTAA